MNTLKITKEQAAVFQSLGKPQEDHGNLTDGIRTIAALWHAAGCPDLPPDPCPRGACTLKVYARRYDGDTIAALRKAGWDGTRYNASRGARRLAEWARVDNPPESGGEGDA